MTYMSNNIVSQELPANCAVKYTIAFTNSPSEVALAQEFRGKLFRAGKSDKDALDESAIHGIIRDAFGEIVCVFRMIYAEGDDLDNCYSAQFYDLESIKNQGLKALELGRFCVHPNYKDPDIIRLAWAELAKFVITENVDLLFGCSSFEGSNAQQHIETLALLKERHLAPSELMPNSKAPKIFPFAKKLGQRHVNVKQALKAMPPLLRSYLSLGGWVSDHVVVDEDLNTVHVFTGVEVKNIPKTRKDLFISLLARA